MTSRDGLRHSLWQDTVDVYHPSSSITEKNFDVIIAGGGMTGVTLGLLLQESGKRCAILEAQTLGFGTTGGTTAHLNTFLDNPYTTIIKDFGIENARTVASATRAAIELVKDNIEKYDIQCGFAEEPGYVFSQNDAQTKQLEDIRDACIDVGVAVEFTNELPLPLSYKKILKIEGQARFHPLQYLFKLAAAFEAAGGTIIQHCRITGHDSGDNLVKVDTGKGQFHGSALVYATHIPVGVNILHLRCPAYRSYALAVELENGQYPQGLIYDMYDPYHYYRTQEIDGRKYFIVGGEDHKTGEVDNTNQCFLELESHTRSHFGEANIAYRWSSQLFEPVDGLPYIGQLPGNAKNVYVATGYGGNGMTYSHVAALVLRGLSLGHESIYSKLFDPGRVKPVAGFTEFIKHNVDVVKQFAGKFFGKEELHELAELAPGEARVVKYEDATIALYKDTEGNLHAVNPACTHMKCAVNWNGAEASWDCPCHGSRFAYNGEMLTGPATQDLEQIEVRSLMKAER